MRIFLSFLVLIFTLQSLAKAESISEFEIEGISVGDSLLDHFEEIEINNLKNMYSENGDLYIFKSKEFYSITFIDQKKFNKYEDLQIVLKDNDTNYIIYAMQGIINYVDNISKCINELDNIELNLDEMFKNTEKNQRYTRNLETKRIGKYMVDSFGYFIGNNSIQVSCADYFDNEKYNVKDALRISIRSEEFNIFINKHYG